MGIPQSQKVLLGMTAWPKARDPVEIANRILSRSQLDPRDSIAKVHRFSYYLGQSRARTTATGITKFIRRYFSLEGIRSLINFRDNVDLNKNS